MKIQQDFARNLAPIIAAFTSQQSMFPASCAIRAGLGESKINFELRNDQGAWFDVAVPLIDKAVDMYRVFGAKDISQWLSSITDDVELIPRSNTIVMIDGVNRQILRMIAQDDHSFDGRPVSEHIISLPVEDFVAILNESTYAVENQEDSAIYQRAVNLQFSHAEGTMLVQAQNGLRGMAGVVENVQVNNDYATLLTKPALRMVLMVVKSLASLKQDMGSVRIGHVPTASTHGNMRVSINVAGIEVTMDLQPLAADPNIVDTRPLFDVTKTDPVSVTVDKTTLKRTLTRIPADNTKTFNRTIRLLIQDGIFYITSVADEERKKAMLGIQEYSITGEPDKFNFKISITYLKQVLAALPGDSVTLTLHNAAGPCEISTEIALARHLIGIRI